MPTERITMQYLVLPSDQFLSPAFDARIGGTGNSPPPCVILDFMYGVAAYQHWHSGTAIDQVMKKRYEEKYRNISILTVSDPSNDRSEEDVEHEEEPFSEGMLRAMDDVLALSMYMKGNTRESLAAERQKREELAEARAQEAGRVKAERWVNETWPSVCSLSLHDNFLNHKTEHRFTVISCSRVF